MNIVNAVKDRPAVKDVAFLMTMLLKISLRTRIVDRSRICVTDQGLVQTSIIQVGAIKVLFPIYRKQLIKSCQCL